MHLFRIRGVCYWRGGECSWEVRCIIWWKGVFLGDEVCSWEVKCVLGRWGVFLEGGVCSKEVSFRGFTHFTSLLQLEKL